MLLRQHRPSKSEESDTRSTVAALPTGAHPAIPAITAPRISHEPAAAAPRAL